ncbi:hypothetical protein QBC34DRAFT_474253 [Podospora aff. communis PSN243]|uniref:Uncharacterized protein n=1 Tax=Podospora aff. communis PSN243 TaxID=3040156 RepID=A0AAV9G8R8_9PEZI|nr:hypothetical protein QBC34DRAFT_474253 [Podospora aff. communis PSN243]
MQLSLKALVLLAPFLSMATALPAAAGAEPEAVTETIAPDTNTTVTALACHANSQYRDQWVENGLTRFRTVFSASGIDPGTHCRYWQAGDCGTNVQCGWDSRVDGGTWRVDANFARGGPGDENYWGCLGSTRSRWLWDYGCTTG